MAWTSASEKVISRMTGLSCCFLCHYSRSLWECRSLTIVSPWAASSIPHPFVYQAVLDPKGTRAVTSGTDRAVRIWDLDSKKELASNEDNQSQVRGLAMMPDGKYFVTAGFD